MKPRDVFSSVADESRGRRGYSDDLHERVDHLVNEYLGLPQGASIPYAASNRAFSAEVESCTDWVKREYKARYGADDAANIGPFGCPVTILMFIIGGLISWLVGRTLDHMFPRGAGDGGPTIYGSE